MKNFVLPFPVRILFKNVHTQKRSMKAENVFTLLCLIVGGGHFAFFRFCQPQNHLIMTPHFMTFVQKVSKTFIFLGKINKITSISVYYDPPAYSTPLQLSTEE